MWEGQQKELKIFTVNTAKKSCTHLQEGWRKKEAGLQRLYKFVLRVSGQVQKLFPLRRGEGRIAKL